MAELLPCPFCGGEAHIGIDQDGEMYKEWFTAYCDNCGAEIKDHRKFMCCGETKDDKEVKYIELELSNKWNTRTPKERGADE